MANRVIAAFPEVPFEFPGRSTIRYFGCILR